MTSIANAPNPFTPLAWLEPNVALHVEVSRYITAMTIGGFVWDIAVNLDSDYQLLFKNKIKYPTIVYYISRIFTLAYIIANFILQIASLKDCQAMMYIQGAFMALSQTTTSLLFLIRVQAVYRGNKLVLVTFCILWLLVLAFSIIFPVHLRAKHIEPTRGCINSSFTNYAEGFIASVIGYDSAVFVVITYRILLSSVLEEGKKARVRAFFGFQHLPAVSQNAVRW
ncbi:hypothetical protein K435DRAFT_818618 [Dendrothele bispora CBS 962.96]|uniref:Uncharacterized protein n=1 Tax=Dendrothele bispora (strain CBS 962.96) TaxID=1314807 RepID=A0A4S8MA12_DENBC|nr:hypothetical protein K435DRAFT_818618 [Dendrothele bispora CBS 962.96]